MRSAASEPRTSGKRRADYCQWETVKGQWRPGSERGVSRCPNVPLQQLAEVCDDPVGAERRGVEREGGKVVRERQTAHVREGQNRNGAASEGVYQIFYQLGASVYLFWDRDEDAYCVHCNHENIR